MEPSPHEAGVSESALREIVHSDDDESCQGLSTYTHTPVDA